jgi:CheY-like chemotaxis protein
MTAATFDHPPPASTVLIVEDDVLMRHVLADSLRECGHRVIEASNALEALEVLMSASVDLCVLGRLERKSDHTLPMAERVKATLANAACPPRQASPAA